jgi:hypothetical protein
VNFFGLAAIGLGQVFDGLKFARGFFQVRRIAARAASDEVFASLGINHELARF